MAATLVSEALDALSGTEGVCGIALLKLKDALKKEGVVTLATLRLAFSPVVATREEEMKEFVIDNDCLDAFQAFAALVGLAFSVSLRSATRPLSGQLFEPALKTRLLNGILVPDWPHGVSLQAALHVVLHLHLFRRCRRLS